MALALSMPFTPGSRRFATLRRRQRHDEMKYLYTVRRGAVPYRFGGTFCLPWHKPYRISLTVRRGAVPYQMHFVLEMITP